MGSRMFYKVFQMKAIIAGNFEWVTAGEGKASRRIRIFANAETGMTVVVVLPLEKTKEGAVLSGFSPMANAILEKYDLDPEKVVWIEYFPEGATHPEAFDLVLTQWGDMGFQTPRRKRILRSEAEALAGSPIKTPK
jgi:hypothetical protein